MFEIARDPELSQEPEYKKALKDALKSAYKFKRNDGKKRSGELWKEEWEFFDELKEHSIYTARQQLKSGEMKQVRYAQYTFKQIVKYDPDKVALLFQAIADYQLKIVTPAKMEAEQALAHFDEKKDEITQANEKHWIDAFIAYTNYMVKIGNSVEAKSAITKAYDKFKDNEDISALFNEVGK